MKSHSTDLHPTVFVVDDDAAVRDSLKLLLRSLGLLVETYDSGQAFLDAHQEDHPGCLVLDLRMLGMSGLEVQRRLNERHSIIPVILITAHGDLSKAVEAMKAGAIDFIQKPFRDQDLINRINQALAKDSDNRRLLSDDLEIHERLATLTPRERQVLDLVMRDKGNEAIAAELKISQRAMEVHLAYIMEKMRASSRAHLVRMTPRG